MRSVSQHFGAAASVQLARWVALCLQGLSAKVKIARALDESRPGAAEPRVVRSQDMAFSGQTSLTNTKGYMEQRYNSWVLVFTSFATS